MYCVELGTSNNQFTFQYVDWDGWKTALQKYLIGLGIEIEIQKQLLATIIKL